MTMPHLMNCSHSEDGWCMDCVGELNGELEVAAYENIDLRSSLNVKDRLIEDLVKELNRSEMKNDQYRAGGYR